MFYETEIGGREKLGAAVKIINTGGIVAFPTETVYGLGGNALDESAVRKIYEAKNRPADNPFTVHLYDFGQARDIACVTRDAERLFEKFTPGPLTVVLEKKSLIPDAVTAGLPTVGIRIPSHPLGREFLKECDLPVAAPSANMSGRISPTSAEFVYEDMKGRIPLILDGGECEVGIESTVISLASNVPTIFRPGTVTLEQIREILPEAVLFTQSAENSRFPGFGRRHYVPKIPCAVFSGVSAVDKAYDEELFAGGNPVILAKNSDLPLFGGRNKIGLGDAGKEIARNVFRILRECEKTYSRIYIEKLSAEGEEGAVMNRLYGSCEGEVLK